MTLRWTCPLMALSFAVALAGCGSAPNTNMARGSGLAAYSINGKGAADESRSIVRLNFRNAAQLEQLAAAGVDLFENVDHQAHTVDATLTTRTQAVLTGLGVTFTVLKGPDRVKALGFPSGYRTVEAVNKELAAVAEAHPAIARLVDLGKSLEGRSIFAIRLTAHPDQSLPTVRIQSGQHARELPTVELTMRLLDVLVSGYGKDAEVTRLVETRDIWILPVVNPDGRTRVEGGSSMWRKNARPLGMGANGVDTNRNADDHFNQGNGMKWADDYHGESPFSEPETQALRGLCDKVHFKVSMDIHNYGGMVLWPPGFTNDVSKDEAAFKAIGDPIAKPLGYKAGTIARTIYKTYGDMATWEYNKYNTLAFAAELNDGTFSPGFGQVDKDWAGWKNNLIFLIDAAGNPRANNANNGKLLRFPGF